MKCKAGLTLLELIIAIAVLMLVMAPMYNIWTAGFKTAVMANNIKTASLIAQQTLEEMVGLTREDFAGLSAQNSLAREDNGFTIRVNWRENPSFTALYDVSVAVYDINGELLCEQEDTVNTAAGGIYIAPPESGRYYAP